MKDTIDIPNLIQAVKDTIYMSVFSTILVFIFGLALGVILFVTNENSIAPNKIVNKIITAFINIFRSIPFMILIILILPFTKLIVGSIIGSTAFIPPLVIGASPFYARMVESSFNEVDKGVIDAIKAMGANTWQIITKVLIRESLPGLISGITITAISIVGYTAMAGFIGGGGLGELANRYGIVKHNQLMVYCATLAALVIVLIIQFSGDYLSKKIDKR